MNALTEVLDHNIKNKVLIIDKLIWLILKK